MRYKLVDDYEKPLDGKETRRITIQHEDGTNLLRGCSDNNCPQTDDREKLDEMIRLANLQADEEAWEAHNW